MGIGQFVMRGWDYIAALKPYGAGMMLETLRFADDAKSASHVFEDLARQTTDPELLPLAEELIARKSKPFDPSLFHDRYQEALAELVAARADHNPQRPGLGRALWRDCRRPLPSQP